MRIRGWAASDVGRKRDHNEDSYLCNDELGLYLVADGMGGHLGGERASRMAVEIVEQQIAAALAPAALAQALEGGAGGAGAVGGAGSTGDSAAGDSASRPTLGGGSGDGSGAGGGSGSAGGAAGRRRSPAQMTFGSMLTRAVVEADRAIYENALADPELTGMGTTLTAALFRDRRAYLGHVGDSRAYLYRDGRARQLTEDHSWIAEQVRAGLMSPEQAKDSRFRNIITRSVGFDPSVQPDMHDLLVQAGDCYLLCSDGLSNYLSLEEIGQVLTAQFYRDAPHAFVEMANERGGDDNVTCICIYVAND